ncbi:MAG: hypothetical protein NTW21_00840 [Verrucomicrobia bacterium]|nr:hypothetical protein [Verrucomicrobiota bacterium]
MNNVWGDLGHAGLAGVMFDCPETGWRYDGGFEDNKATTAGAYRKTFELAREGPGPNGYLHERLLGDPVMSSRMNRGSSHKKPGRLVPFFILNSGIRKDSTP